MKKEIADKWVEALRSEKYEQGIGYLKIDGKYCCLGVLCDLAISESIGKWVDLNLPSDEKIEAFSSPTAFYNEYRRLPDEIMNWAGMKTCIGCYGDSWGCTLSNQNDVLKQSFKKIADTIEQNWEQL